MAPSFYHQHPNVLALETEVVDSRPGRVLLRRSPFFPGGGGQLADRGTLLWNGGVHAIKGFEPDDGLWHLLDDPSAEIHGSLKAVVDPAFRRMMMELHTATHILNALVFQMFSGALVTSAQMNDDGTARLDFDLPQADNSLLKALEAQINDVIRQDLLVRTNEMPLDGALLVPGLIRSKSVAPPPSPDGLIRIVEIIELDRQACGGTHLVSTGDSRTIRILKISNKGRHNRRVRIGLAGVAF